MSLDIYTYNIHVARVPMENYIRNEAIQNHGTVHLIFKCMEITLTSTQITNRVYYLNNF